MYIYYIYICIYIYYTISYYAILCINKTEELRKLL